MSRNQRFAMLAIAVVIAVAAVFVLTGSDDEPEQAANTAQTTVPEPEPTSPSPNADSTPAPDAEEEAARPQRPRRPPLPLLTSGKVREIEVKQGDTVRFAARANEDEEVHVHGYDISKEAPAGETIRMSFEADLTGIYEIEFEHAGEPIAELRVEP